MPAPLSTDLRMRVLEARTHEGLTYEALAERFMVGRATVNRILRRARETGSVEPAPHGGGPTRRLIDTVEEDLRELVRARPDATLEELCIALAGRTGVGVSRATMCRELRRLGFTRKKKSLVPTEQGTPEVLARREAFLAEVQACDPERLIFIDESGSNIAMTRAFAWAPRGTRAFGRVPRNRGRSTTMIAALSIDGIEALMTVQGGTTAAVFLKFLDEHLVPKLHAGDVVVLDNLGAHHATGVRERIEAAGARLLYQPPYSPDLNPIELGWSKIKGVLRGFTVRTVAFLLTVIAFAASSIMPKDAAGWFKHCGIFPTAQPA